MRKLQHKLLDKRSGPIENLSFAPATKKGNLSEKWEQILTSVRRTHLFFLP